MNEVTNTSFEPLLPDIKKTLTEADFVSFDCEFTGIRMTSDKESLHDISTRYELLCKSIHPYAIVQLGLTAFKQTESLSGFNAKGYKFYLVPRTIPAAHRKLEWQVTTLEFLAAHKFDFNKVVYDGISYMNEPEEANLKAQLTEETLSNNVGKYTSVDDDDLIKEYANQVEAWYGSDSGDAFSIETSSSTIQYLLHKEIRNRFPKVWTMSSGRSVVTLKTTMEVRELLIKKEGAALEEALIDSYIGFSKLFKVLCSLRKPIVGHNVFLDLMFMYKQFYEPLPKLYSNFAKGITELFPEIYDTKFIFQTFTKGLLHAYCKGNSLGEIYKFMKETYNNSTVPNSPLVMLNDSTEFDLKFHDAGWDSFCTGYVFIKLAYMLASRKEGLPEAENCGPLSFELLLEAVKHAQNRVHASQYKHIKLDCVPQPKNPGNIFDGPMRWNEKTGDQVTGRAGGFLTLNSLFRTQKQNHFSTCASVQLVMKRFEPSRASYRPIRNVPAGRLSLWCRVALTSGVVAWIAHGTSVRL